jgi:RNA polymerase sigma-70 factor (ECF subfamily)
MTSMTIDADCLRRLVADAQRGDRGAAERLIREHEGWVRSAIYAVTGRADLVDDIAQLVWTRVWRRLSTLENPRQLRTWLYSIAHNTALDARLAVRRRQARTAGLDTVAGASDGKQSGPLRVLTGGELQHTLLEAVRELPAIYREPFVLRHLEDWSYAEIGQVLDLPVDTVETRLTRARRMLRETLRDRVEL